MALVCGPEIMMRFSAAELEKRGVAASNIFVSMERNMKCAVGFCGHCQYGPDFVCKDGPVFQYSHVKDLLVKWEI
jgi:NAD(P)H-flavin reductase